MSSGLLWLKSSIGSLTNTYTTALLAYTFSLAGENEIRGQLLKELDNLAVSGGNKLKEEFVMFIFVTNATMNTFSSTPLIHQSCREAGANTGTNNHSHSHL